MIAGIFFSIAALCGLCILLYNFFVYMLAAYVGLAAGFWVIHAGGDIVDGLAIGLFVCGVVLGLSHLAFTIVPSRLAYGRARRFAVLAGFVFAVLAGFAGYNLITELLDQFVPPTLWGWRIGFGLVAAVTAALTVAARIAGPYIPHAWIPWHLRTSVLTLTMLLRVRALESISNHIVRAIVAISLVGILVLAIQSLHQLVAPPLWLSWVLLFIAAVAVTAALGETPPWVSGKRLSQFVLTALTAGMLAVLIGVVVRTMTQSAIDIGPIAVPKDLVDQGFTSAVAGQRLRDAINRIVMTADSSMELEEFRSKDAEPGPEIVVREVGFHPDALAGWLGNKLGLRHQQDISGEITISERVPPRAVAPTDGSAWVDGAVKDEPPMAARERCLSLRTRWNGHSFHNSESPQGECEKSFDRLFDEPAAGILELASPYFVGVVCFTKDPSDQFNAQEIANRIIATQRDTEEVARAHNLRAWLLYEQNYQNAKKSGDRPRQFGNIIAEFAAATKENPALSIAYRYRAFVNMKQAIAMNEEREQDRLKFFQEAKKDYQQGIEKSPKEPEAYTDFGDFLRIEHKLRVVNEAEHKHNISEAEHQYRQAIKIGQDSIRNDPLTMRTTQRMGHVYHDLGHAWLWLGKLHKEELWLGKLRKEEPPVDTFHKALAALERATELDPFKLDADYELLLTVDELLLAGDESETLLLDKAEKAFADFEHLLSKLPEGVYSNDYVKDLTLPDVREYNHAIERLRKRDEKRFKSSAANDSQIHVESCPRRKRAS
jgi:tetratricopeptide (TPR) repeat protein